MHAMFERIDPPRILRLSGLTLFRLTRPLRLTHVAALLLVLALSFRSAEGASGPKEVHVGIFVKQLRGISLRESHVVVDFHIWFRWTDDGLKPLDSFELINGTVESKQNLFSTEGNGYHYAACRVIATIHKVWDVARYPLDAHIVTIELEDSEREADKLIYLPDVENSGLSPDAGAAGWVLRNGNAEVVTHTDRTNYGDLSLPTNHESAWSRFVFYAQLSRPGFGIFIKLFTGLFVATAIALHGILIPPNQLDARLALTVGAMFAAVASEYLVASGLPESNGMTLADKLHVLSFFLIFISLVESVKVYKMVLRGEEARAVRTDRVCFWAFLIGYCCAATLLVWG